MPPKEKPEHSKKKKFKMPTVQEFLSEKRLYEPKKDPVWVYLEREMRAAEEAGKKPYNQKVGNWLKWLKDFRAYKNREFIKIKKQLYKMIGPLWYTEMSVFQQDIIKSIKSNISQDLIEGVPVRTWKCLAKLGITGKIQKSTMLNSMHACNGDTGLFFWYLYTSVYKHSPSELRHHYDNDAKILMSSMVFLDIDECIEELEKLTKYLGPKIKPPPSKPPKHNVKPKGVKYAEYLEKFYVKCYMPKKLHEKKAVPLDYKVKVRSESSMENLCQNLDFIKLRIERSKKEQLQERICKYKFWEPPADARFTDPKLAEYAKKLRMYKLKAKKKFQAPLNNMQFMIAGVSFTGGKPRYILQCVAVLPTGFLPQHGGFVDVGRNNPVTYTPLLADFRKDVQDADERCDAKCECMRKWGPSVMEYLKKTHCKCGHNYDMYNTGVCKEKFFYQATRFGKHRFDEAKIYQLDPWEDFIKDAIDEALVSKEPTGPPSMQVSPFGIQTTELLGYLLAEISKTPLIIPHLPLANFLNSLRAWMRYRMHGPIDAKTHNYIQASTERRWAQLNHLDFRARAYRIPFTEEQLHNFNWSHRGMVQKLYRILLKDFIQRNAQNQVEQSRVWWPTMKYYYYPNEAFMDTFFTFLPNRLEDTTMLNPYNPNMIPKAGGKTCPLNP